MDFGRPTLLLLVLGVINGLAQDSSLKSSSKVSEFKSKLAKTELSAKAVESIDDVLSVSDLDIPVPTEHLNDSVIKKDYHTYYNSTFYANPNDAKQFWIALDQLPENHVTTHEKLSDSYRQATTVELSFDFPFYGSLLRNVTIATGGFLYMGDYLHNWIAATQYVAPLMANFDTRLSNDSLINYADNGTAFTVQWEKVHIQNRHSDGAFTFQVTLLKNGDIIFAYKDVPYSVSTISDSQHPVKVGLSDAYILERPGLFFSRKTVYEYNRIQIANYSISNNTAIHFTAVPTCNTFKDCSTCVSSGSKLQCNWCEAVKRCSDGIDRQRQSWVVNGCIAINGTVCLAGKIATSTDKTEINIFTHKGTEVSKLLPNKISTSSASSASSAYNVDDSMNSNGVYGSNEAAARVVPGEESGGKRSNVSPGAIATIMVFLVVVVAVSVWVFYAYKNPQSTSGQFLIKYRPSQWTVKKESSVAAANSRHL